MKKSILLLICVTFGTLLFAQYSADKYKYRMIENINKGKFKQAIKLSKKVEDWDFNPDDEKAWLKVEEAREFALYIDSIGLPKPLLARLLAYEYDVMFNYYQQSLDNTTSISVLETILSLQRIFYGEQHPVYAASLHNLGNLYSDMGDYAKAEPYYLESLSIWKSVLGAQHPVYATSLNNLGVLYSDMGDYGKAERYYSESLAIRKSVLGAQHPDYAQSLNNLGSLYYKMGDYAKAEPYYLESLSIRKSVYGEQHPDYAASLNNLGVLYSDMGDYGKAERYYLESLSIYKSVLGEQHPDYATSLNNLGSLYSDMGDYGKAERYYSESLAIRKSVLGEQHPDYALSLNNLGVLYSDMGDYGKAEQCQLEALSIWKSVYGEQHPDYATSLNNLGLLYDNMGDYGKAEPYYAQAMPIYKQRFIQATDFMSERERNLYWATMQNCFYETYPCFSYRYYSTKPSISAFAYNNELFSKGLLLSSSQAVQSSILQSNDTALVRRWQELTTKKQQILALSESAPQSPYLAELQQQAEELEKEVIRRSVAFRQSRERWGVTWDSVRAHLSEGEVAIEYFSAPLTADSTMYCALLLRHSSAYPMLIPLFNETEVLPLINTSINKTYQYIVDDTVTIGNGKRLSDLVWGNVLPYIKPGETIYFSASGLLHQLGIESLPFDEHRMMSDLFTLVRVSSTREVVFRDSPAAHSSATLYGGIRYNLSGEELLAESAQYATNDLLASRGIENDTLNRGNARYLPGTQKEVDYISDQLNRNHLDVRVYTAAAANEESFKALSGTHQNILHIATHGFYWSDSTARQQDYFSQRMLMMGDNKPAPVVNDPLNRCGLLLAGANIALTGHSADIPEGVQDGILTAKEISLLHFRETDLVVLSACETGTGDITGEGVFGLQRAFKQAGVQTIIMSLWKVNDVATQLFMTEFYKNWIEKKQSKRDAFRNAQNTVRAHHPEPYYWAGFVMLD